MVGMIHATTPWSDGCGYKYDSPYTELAAGIVHQAVKDYISAIRRMWDRKLSRKEKQDTFFKKLELEDFFRSSWYDTLCDIDPDKVIQNSYLCAEEQEREAIRKQNRKRMNRLLKETAGKEDTT